MKKRFRFNYPPYIWCALILIILITVYGIVANVFNIVQYKNLELFRLFSYCILTLLSFIILVVDFLFIFNGCYTIKNNRLYTHFGPVFHKIDIEKITEFTHFKKSDKLVMYFEENSFSVIMISPKFYDEFVKAVKEKNPLIFYQVNSQEKEDV